MIACATGLDAQFEYSIPTLVSSRPTRATCSQGTGKVMRTRVCIHISFHFLFSVHAVRRHIQDEPGTQLLVQQSETRLPPETLDASRGNGPRTKGLKTLCPLVTPLCQTLIGPNHVDCWSTTAIIRNDQQDLRMAGLQAKLWYLALHTSCQIWSSARLIAFLCFPLQALQPPRYGLGRVGPRTRLSIRS
jgi:hypothetical protein